LPENESFFEGFSAPEFVQHAGTQDHHQIATININAGRRPTHRRMIRQVSDTGPGSIFWVKIDHSR
jgi:hypothetical protein